MNGLYVAFIHIRIEAMNTTTIHTEASTFLNIGFFSSNYPTLETTGNEKMTAAANMTAEFFTQSIKVASMKPVAPAPNIFPMYCPAAVMLSALKSTQPKMTKNMVYICIYQPFFL